MELSDLVRKSAFCLGLTISTFQIPAQTVSSLAEAKSDAGQQSKIGYDEAKKSQSKKVKKEYLTTLMYEMGILHDKVKSPDCHVSTFYDYDDPADKKKLEDWLVEQSKNVPDVDTKAFEKTRKSKVAYNLEGKPGQKEKRPFIIVYTNELFELAEEDIKSKLDGAKAITASYDLGTIFGK